MSLINYTIPIEWYKDIEEILLQSQQKKLIVLICGKRNSGKSSFIRYLSNRLLNIHQSINIIDTDLGQSEFTPSGFISFINQIVLLGIS